MATNIYSESEWERMRPFITRLYLEDGKPLKEVAKFMAETHDFKPTPRMYKHRFRKWQLEKNFKEQEVVQMYLLNKQRAAQGKSTVFFVRGKQVDWNQVEKYVYRRPDLENRIRMGMVRLSESIPGLECRSPPQSPRHASDVLHYTDEVLRLLNGYYISASEPGGVMSRPIASDSSIMATQLKWVMGLFQARTMICTGATQGGFQFLGQCLDSLQGIIKEEDATLILDLCDLATLFDQRHQTLSFELIRHAYNLLREIFGDRHPFVCLFHRLARLPEKDRIPLILTISRAVLDGFHERPNVDSRMVEHLECHYFVLIEYIRGIEYIGGQSMDSTASFPNLDIKSLEARSISTLCRHTSQLIAAGDVEQAEAKLPLVLHWIENPANYQHSCWPDIQLGYSKIKGYCEHVKNQRSQPMGSVSHGELPVREGEAYNNCCEPTQDAPDIEAFSNATGLTRVE